MLILVDILRPVYATIQFACLLYNDPLLWKKKQQTYMILVV